MCRAFVLIGRLEGCFKDRGTLGTQMGSVKVVSYRSSRYEQECCQSSDADAFERCHAGSSGAGFKQGRSTWDGTLSAMQ
jgi:hypothetical protein